MHSHNAGNSVQEYRFVPCGGGSSNDMHRAHAPCNNMHNAKREVSNGTHTTRGLDNHDGWSRVLGLPHDSPLVTSNLITMKQA